MYRSALLILTVVLVSVVSVSAQGAVVSITAKKVLVSKRAANGSEQKVPAVEFTVTTDKRYQARALEPVLYVGKVSITQYRFGDTDYKLIFTCFEPDKLEDDVPMLVGYPSDLRDPFRPGLSRDPSDKALRFRLSMIEPL